MSNAFLGIDTGSISTKGVIILPDGTIIARSYLWTEGNPTDAARRVVEDLKSQINTEEINVVAVGATGSARRLVGSILDATVVKTRSLPTLLAPPPHPDVRTILEIGGQDSKIICVENGSHRLCHERAVRRCRFVLSGGTSPGVEVEEFGPIVPNPRKSPPTLPLAARCSPRAIWCTSCRLATLAKTLCWLIAKQLPPTT